MDTFLAIASRRETRDYADTPIPEDIVQRILDAGRLSGSSKNTQKWEFVVVRDHAAMAECGYAPGNVLGATPVVSIAGPAGGTDLGQPREMLHRQRLEPDGTALECGGSNVHAGNIASPVRASHSTPAGPSCSPCLPAPY